MFFMKKGLDVQETRSTSSHSVTAELATCVLFTRYVKVGSKVGQIGRKWDKSGTFFSESQNVLKLILKSRGFVPFRANLTHFRDNSDTPGKKYASS